MQGVHVLINLKIFWFGIGNVWVTSTEILFCQRNIFSFDTNWHSFPCLKAGMTRFLNKAPKFLNFVIKGN